MVRSFFTSAFVAAGLLWTLCGGSPVMAGGQQPQAGAAPARDDDDSAARRIDKAILAYESRVDQEIDQTRKEINRLQKELSEMVELQFGLVIALAELQAEMKAQQLVAVAEREASPSPGESGAAASNQAEERRRLRCLELNRELRAVLDNLRGMVSQKRSETDQLVLQLRNLRVQQRQLAAEIERGKQPVKPSQD
jgi:hypothetical protein